MGKFSDDFIKTVSNATDIAALIGGYLRLDRKGGRLWGLCPFHSEKSPSFTVDPEKGFFYCFGCKKGGSALDFYMEIEKASFREAVTDLAARAGIPLPEASDSPEQEQAARERDAKAELYARIAGTFHHLLVKHPSGAKALAYIQSRAISDELVERFQLGYAPADRRWLGGFLKGKGYSQAFLAETGLFSEKYPDSSFFSNRLMFPIRDRRGTTVGFGGRLLEGEGPKYLNTRETAFFKKGEQLFAIDMALPAIKAKAEAIVCEGYMDALACHQAGVTQAVAPLGTAFTQAQAELLKRWAPRVVFLFDSDEAGQNATDKALVTALNSGLEPEVVLVDGGKDPSEVLQKDGAEALVAMIGKRRSWIDYCLKKALARFDISSPHGKRDAIAYFFPFLGAISSDIVKEGFLDAISRSTGIDSYAIKKEYSTRQEPSRPAVARPSPEDKVSNQDLSLLIVLALNDSLYPRFRTDISGMALDDSQAKEIYFALEEAFRRGESGVDSVISKLSDEGLKELVLRKAASGEFDQNADRYVAEGITQLKIRALERKQSEVLMQIRSMMSQEQREDLSLNDLLYEKMHLDSELAALKDVRDERN